MIKEIKKKEWENLFTKELNKQFIKEPERVKFMVQSILEDLEILGKLNGDNGDSAFYIQNVLYKTGENCVMFDYIFTNTKFEKWIGKNRFKTIHYSKVYFWEGKSGVLDRIKICKSYFK